jgi:NitT/TauT family transport system permease protein
MILRRPSIRWIATTSCTIALIIVFLALWQYLPTVPSLSRRGFLNVLLISSPTRIAGELWAITFGISHGMHWYLLPYLEHTVEASILGVIVGVLSGYFVGLFLSEVKFLDEVLRPIIVFLNTVPRILVIPLIIIIFGFGQTSEIIAASITVFYVIFFNAYQGGRSSDPAIITFVKVLGAKRIDILTRVRAYNALVWTAAQMPNATAFGLLVTITAEILGTGNGIGYLIFLDMSYLDTSQLFALMAVTSVYGFLLVNVTRLIVKSALKWNREVT